MFQLIFLAMAYYIAEGKIHGVYDSGVDAGYEWGYADGVRAGHEFGCMVKPI